MRRFRNALLPHMKFALGTGSDIDLWFDPWCDKGRLVYVLGYQAMAEVGGIHSKVSQYIIVEN